jgi:AcrR family transcriptional regulator
MVERDALRERVLCEAERVLREEGFFGVSLRQVATNAGVHPRTVTVLFGGKRNLLKLVEARLKDKEAEQASGT